MLHGRQSLRFYEGLRLYKLMSGRGQVGLQEYSERFNRASPFFWRSPSPRELVVKHFIDISSSGDRMGLVRSFLEPKYLWDVEDEHRPVAFAMKQRERYIYVGQHCAPC